MNRVDGGGDECGVGPAGGPASFADDRTGDFAIDDEVPAPVDDRPMTGTGELRVPFGSHEETFGVAGNVGPATAAHGDPG